MRKDTRMVDPRGMGMGVGGGRQRVKPALPPQASPTAVAARGGMPGQTKPVARPVAPSGAAMKKGGKVACMAMGGVAKIRHNQATSSGAPKAGGKRFKGNLI